MVFSKKGGVGMEDNGKRRPKAIRELSTWDLLRTCQDVRIPKDVRLLCASEYMERTGRNLHTLVVA